MQDATTPNRVDLIHDPHQARITLRPGKEAHLNVSRIHQCDSRLLVTTVREIREANGSRLIVVLLKYDGQSIPNFPFNRYFEQTVEVNDTTCQRQLP